MVSLLSSLVDMGQHIQTRTLYLRTGDANPSFGGSIAGIQQRVHCGSRIVVSWRSGPTDAVNDRIRSRPIRGPAAPGHVLIGSHKQQRGFVALFECLTA